MKFVDDTESISRASSGWLKDWYATGRDAINSDDSAQVPFEKSFDLLYEMYKEDPTVFATVNTFVNKAVANGWRLEGANKQQLKLAEKTMQDLKFDIVLPNILKNMVVYGDAFLEVEYFEGSQRPKALHVLETTQMEIVSDEHGDVSGYVQRKGGKDPVRFTTEEVVHFKWLDFGGRLFGMSQLRNLMKTVGTKKFAENFNVSTFKNFSPRMAWIVKNGSEEQTKAFIDMLKMSKDHPNKDIVVNGDVEFKPLLQTSDDTNFIELQKFLREQIMMTTQVPPIMVGLPDNSNRANSEAQMRAFEGNVKAIQRPAEFTITDDLLNLFGYKATEFKFNPLDKRNEKDDLEIAQAMAAIGIDGDTILDFLKKAGIELREGASIKVPSKVKPTTEDEAGRTKSRSDLPEEMKSGSESGTREDQLRRSWESQLLGYKEAW